MKEGFATALKKANIPCEEQDGGLYATIPPGEVDAYIDLAKQFIQPGCWNEVVGTRWVFIFPEGLREWDSIDSDAVYK